MPTKRQREVLNYITKYHAKSGYAPSLKEIQEGFGFASVSTAHFHVRRLQEAGYLTKHENKPRSISISENEPMVQVPLLGTIAAGQPIEAIENKEYIAITQSRLPNSGDIFALRVIGDSMINENINDGDVVLVKQQAVAENGQKVVALIDNHEATLKKLYKERGYIRLQPANNSIEPIIIDGNQSLAIQGVVIDIIKSAEEAPDINFKTKQEKTDSQVKLKKNKIVCEDCINGLKSIPTNSIDACITDPPYNYEFVGHKWDAKEIERRTSRVKNSKTLVKHIPYGSGLAGGVRNERWYKKNRDNILEYQKWCMKWGAEVFRVLKPGAYILVFNSSRTVAHVQIALENAGFYARDIIVWRKNSGIPKGLNFVKKLEKDGIGDAEKWKGWHSCLRNEWEAIVILQKPLNNNYLQTVKEYGVGLLHAENGDGKFLSNIIENIKRDEKEDFNVHCTIKPTQLISKLIDLVIPKNKSNIVLDPFMGSGTTAIAALINNVSYLGFEINQDYCSIAKKRIEKYVNNPQQKLL